MMKTENPSGMAAPVNSLGPMGPIAATIERPCSPDIMLGAYLVTHLQQRCENCGITDTPQWRKGWFSNILNRSVVLCNACGLKYNKNQFCPYCMYVYYKEEDKKSKNTWLICEACQRWVHAECEQQYGGKEQVQQWSQFHSYLCPGCRDLNISNPESAGHTFAHSSPEPMEISTESAEGAHF
jgi:hypothetical protein